MNLTFSKLDAAAACSYPYPTHARTAIGPSARRSRSRLSPWRVESVAEPNRWLSIAERIADQWKP